MRKAVVVASALSVCLVAVAAVVAVNVVQDSRWWCFHEEAQDYPAVEAAAQDALGDRATKHQRVSVCESTGSPAAFVYSTVQGWSDRTQAQTFLRSQGWTRALPKSSWLKSPDGKYWAETQTASNAFERGSHVEIAFSKAHALG